ncbi:adhesin [Burkholderia sp. Bp9017]|uniref:Adhesin n=1 Tax=Burkholderia anthina TaxID=179879 RepID=A0A7T7AJJ0_9BURK|nr:MULTISPECIES: adhesin [Burkholderia]MBY4865056.1 adhesin [Burkholderia anthina]QQK05026.1 adhesin [Burkholderia anthina]RQZ25459.1 adhesin [Burkholderia sp. Bp9017]RQZ33419.1 adhesin [Burkholderia sp. Bp9016]
MRRTVHVVFFALLVYLIGDRAMLHAQGRDASPLACTQAAEQIKYDALSRGFGNAAAGSQSEAFMSGCLVTGRGAPDVAMASR